MHLKLKSVFTICLATLLLGIPAFTLSEQPANVHQTNSSEVLNSPVGANLVAYGDMAESDMYWVT